MPNRAASFAPGRVELLGNHTDYNHGVVLSAAIDLGVTVSGAVRPDDLIEVRSETNDRSVRVNSLIQNPEKTERWANYPLGVIKLLAEAGCPVRGMNLKIQANLPVGAGLSSSAAFEVATALTVCRLCGFSLEPMALAKLCRRAENEFVGVQSGLLDQASSVFGQTDHLIFLDFQTLAVGLIALSSRLGLLITNSGVPHELAGGEYNQRYQECMEAARLLGLPSLREASSAQLKAASLDPLLARRALHITEENERVAAGVRALRSGDTAAFGRLMFLSHASSRVNFENSTTHLDALVDIASSLDGVLGSRLTGGGFGGSTISLIQVDRAPSIIAELTREYTRRTGAICTPILTRASQGARVTEWR
jgi:galactokinase